MMTTRLVSVHDYSEFAGAREDDYGLGYVIYRAFREAHDVTNLALRMAKLVPESTFARNFDDDEINGA